MRLALLALVLVGTAAMAQPDPRVVRAEYVGTSEPPAETWWLYLVPGSPCPLPLDHGGACFQVLPGETRVSVRFEDDVTAFPDAHLSFLGGPSFYGGRFCGHVEDVPIPEGTTRVVVRTTLLRSVVNFGCWENDPPIAHATHGFIVATFE